MLHHERGKAAYCRIDLNMQVSEHIITVPTTNPFDYVIINFGAEQRNGASCAEGPGRHILGDEVKVGDSEGDCGFQCT